MADGNYCTVADVKLLLSRKPSTVDDDGLINQIIERVSEEFRTEMGREILTTEYTEVRDGTGTTMLQLSAYPVLSVSSLQLGWPTNRTTLTAQTDYLYTRYGVRLVWGIFPMGVGNVSITYTAGFPAYPKDIVGACAVATVYRYKQADRIGQNSKTAGEQTYQYITSPFPSDVQKTLNQYKKLVPL